MTDTERNDAIIDAIDRYTNLNTTSKAAARKTLIDEGIYTQKGKLRAEFRSAAKGKASV